MLAFAEHGNAHSELLLKWHPCSPSNDSPAASPPEGSPARRRCKLPLCGLRSTECMRPDRVEMFIDDFKHESALVNPSKSSDRKDAPAEFAGE